jgi:hypothetical protein
LFLNRLAYDTRLAAINCAKSCGNFAVIEQLCFDVIHAVQHITHDLQSLAILGTSLADAMLRSKGGSKDDRDRNMLENVAYRAYIAMKLCYGDDHFLVDSCREKFKVYIDAVEGRSKRS